MSFDATRRITNTAAVILLILSVGLAAAAAEPAEEPALVRMTVRAERIVFDDAKHSFRCSRNVVIIRGNVTLECQQVEGSLDPETRKISGLIAIGDVVIISKGGRSECHLAKFDTESQIIEMTGTEDKQPTIWRGKDGFQADKIIYDQKLEKVRLEGNASAIIETKAGEGGLEF